MKNLFLEAFNLALKISIPRSATHSWFVATVIRWEFVLVLC